jgi:nitrogen fixation/metabolism regulation signal transduction histidine kinase
MAWNFKVLPAESLESSLRWQGLSLWLCTTALALLVSWTWPLWWVWLMALLFTLWLNRQQQLQAKRQLAAFNRASVQLEALHNQDYSLQARAAYRSGIAAGFQQQLHQLSQQLQQRKSFFDEQQFLLYRLIDQLNTPILVFDHKQQLSYANNEFVTLFGRPWQSMRHASASLLGLHPEPDWHFADAVKQRQWQIRHSRFLEQGQRQQLLVFINIQSALRETELRAWQQLIRVLSHEIRNSLTPVLALSEHLQQKLPDGREQQALQVILERSRHLQDFVSRYSELNKPLTINLQRIDSDQLCNALQLLFDGQLITHAGPAITFVSDMTLLQQVLINLLKNAFEAGSPPGTVEIRCRQQSQVLIEVLDQGQGLLALQDLFVPFYSTKPTGQGIGLVLCRQIIEQLGGSLSLANRTDHSNGVCAQIILPSLAARVNEEDYSSLLPSGTD